MAKSLKLIGADALLPCDKYFSTIKRGGVLFDEGKILKVGDFDELKKEKVEARFYESCVIVPAFINAHAHFEFSANESTLRLGDFGGWLNSVIESRESLMQGANPAIEAAIVESLKSGVACVGAISSAGADLDSLMKSPLKVLFFNEIMGTNEGRFEAIKRDFEARFRKSMMCADRKFKVGVALHSPYSLAPELAHFALKIALENDLPVSAHFLESRDELQWLDNKRGYFKEFFKRFFGLENAAPLYTKEGFLELFDKKIRTLFTHCLYLDNDTWERISRLNCGIVSCPRSNRLLNNRYFDFLKAHDYKIPLIIATDGKSSNNNVSILDEARTALFAYEKYHLDHLAREILLAITRHPAKWLGFNNGVLEKSRSSDFAVFRIKDIAKSEQIALNLILHANEVEALYIDGKKVEI